ncbi:MAG: site-2 protease family protein [Acidimicrobiia bacterium]
MHLDQQTVIYFGCIIVAVILHEVSHGVVALWFGDRTAKEAGRVTLNPIPHIDPFGSIVLPAMGALTGIPILAWAKPVPVNPARLRNPRRDMVWVSLAGPITNFALMTLAALSARAAYENTTPVYSYAQLPLGIRLLFSFAVVNMFLGLFNLLPIPPLDGSALIERVLPGAWLPNWYKFRPYGFLVLFLLVFSTGVISTFLDPFLNSLFDFVFR